MKIEPNRDFGSRECPSCACEVAANNNRCPICSYEFPAASPRQRHMKTWGALLMLGLLFLMFVLRYL